MALMNEVVFLNSKINSTLFISACDYKSRFSIFDNNIYHLMCEKKSGEIIVSLYLLHFPGVQMSVLGHL